MNDINEKVRKQTYDSGAVIGYVPLLEYVKDLNNLEELNIGTSTNNIIQAGVDTYVYSKCLNSFCQNKPSDAMKALDYAINNMEMLLDRLSDKFINERDSSSNPFAPETKGSQSDYDNDPYKYTGGDINIKPDNGNPNSKWDDYNDPTALRNALDNGDNDYVDKFIDYHSKDINGSIIPEIFKYIHDSESGLKNIKDMFSNLFYNAKITTDEAKKLDDIALGRMRDAEKSNQTSIINYPILNFDSILSRSIQMHAYRDNKQAINVANVIIKRDKGTASPNDMDVIKKLYQEVNDSLDKRAGSYNKTQAIELMQKALYNYYETRRYLNSLYKLKQDNNSSESVFIGRKIQEYANRTQEALKNVNRVCKLDQLNLEKIYELEKEKFFIKKLYNSTSNIS